jgi:hypothetical protein
MSIRNKLPHDYLNSYDRLNDTELPSKQAFFDRMNNYAITDEEYNICVNVWKNNNMKTFKDFLEWYYNLDVLQFIEAVEILEKMKTFFKLKRLDI